MRYLILLLCIFAAAALHAQSDMRVYTVAGKYGATDLGDGGPATAALMGSTEGIWVDASCNLYISDMGNSRIRKVSLKTGIITTLAGSSSSGFSGDGGPATNAKIKGPYGLWSDMAGNVYFADASNKRIRSIDVTSGIISTFAGGGTETTDGGLATNALLSPGYVYGDNAGNIYIGESGKIRKVNSSGIITTIAGTGINGLSGDGGPATNAQVYGPAGMLLDASGNILFADRGNSRIRKINKTTGIISTVAGTTVGYSGDGGPATNAQLSGPISFAIDYLGNLIIGDNGNNYIRKVNAATGMISTIAGVGPMTTGNKAEGVLAMEAEIHPEFLYLDLEGNLYYSSFGDKIRKIINCNGGLVSSGSTCQPTDVNQLKGKETCIIYPNPTNHLLHIDNLQTNAGYRILSIVGAAIQQGQLRAGNNELNVRALPPGMYLLEVNEDGKRSVQKIVVN